MNRSKLCGRLLLTAILMLLAIPGIAIAQRQTPDCGSAAARMEAGHWFWQLNMAWERLDAVAATALFTDHAEYQDYPFDAPLRGRQAIRAYWDGVAHGQRDVHTSYEVLSACGDSSIVHWTASFVRVPSGQQVRLDGIAEVTLDQHGKCESFHEWWDREQGRAQTPGAGVR